LWAQGYGCESTMQILKHIRNIHTLKTKSNYKDDQIGSIICGSIPKFVQSIWIGHG
jgi:hypothetical protein